MKDELSNIRRDFNSGSLSDENINKNPMAMFANWLNEAIKKGISESNAMTLSTVNKKNEPSSRIVLLRGLDERGFIFYTNYNSLKSKEIIGRDQVALNFFWPVLERQVRVKGMVKKLPDKESDEYFASRPRESQIAAWASPQSEVIESRKALVERFAEVEKKLNNLQITRPSHWGGLVVFPHYYEFWQGGPFRLHDRFSYALNKKNEWLIDRLAP